MSLTYAELFAGAGGLSMGLEAGGFHAVAHAEIEPHARAVLRHRWPGVRLDGDVTQINGADYAGVTLLSGGSPCQDLSVAGKRAGLEGARSGLFQHQVRIWQESGAPYLLWENVYGALSSNGGRDFATVLSTIVGAPIAVPADGWQRAGVAAGSAAVAAWRVLDLQHFGPPQRRVRVFILAARAGGVDPAEVLLEPSGVCGHPSPRQQQREGAARGAGAGAAYGIKGSVVGPSDDAGSQRSMTKEEGMFCLQTGEVHGVVAWDNELNASVESHGPLMARGKSGGDRNGVVAFHPTQTPISGTVSPSLGRTTEGMGVVCITGDTTHALTHEGADASEDGTGHGTPVVLASGQANAEAVRDGDPSLTALHEAPIVVPTLSMGAHTAAPGSNGQDAAEYAAITTAHSGRPRRLTPLECERLMSWPDRWTATGVDEAGREYALSDTARYRLCGNGVGSVCVAWIAKRLAVAIAEGGA